MTGGYSACGGFHSLALEMLSNLLPPLCDHSGVRARFNANYHNDRCKLHSRRLTADVSTFSKFCSSHDVARYILFSTTESSKIRVSWVGLKPRRPKMLVCQHCHLVNLADMEYLWVDSNHVLLTFDDSV